MPMAASFFVFTFLCIQVIATAVINPAMTEPVKKPRALYPTTIKAT